VITFLCELGGPAPSLCSLFLEEEEEE